MGIFILALFFMSLLVYKEIEGKCCPILELPQIMKVMQFVCKTLKQKYVEVVNNLKNIESMRIFILAFFPSSSQ